MARYSVSWTAVTPTAFADTANFTDSAYPTFLQCGNVANYRLNINEVYIGGEAAASSSPTLMVLARDSTLAATAISGNRLAAMDFANVAPGTVPVYGNVSTTKPQRSSTLHLLHLSYNAYGGIARWQARYGEEINLVGTTQPGAEVSLSAYTGGTPGACSGHILFEAV